MRKFLYPNGKQMALTFSYDDGREYDRQLVQVLNRFGMKGTFHLNSGSLGQSGTVRAEEIKTLYAGHEVACHGVTHREPLTASLQEMVQELMEDRKTLERLTGGMVQGLSYAFGDYTTDVLHLVKALGFQYARTTQSTYKFIPPRDFLEWHPSCHQMETDKMMALGQRFLQTGRLFELPVLYVWGHSYEFDWMLKSWKPIEQFCQLMAGHEDVWYATNMEICRYIHATRRQEFSADGSRIYNPTLETIWLQCDDQVCSVAPGETAAL